MSNEFQTYLSEHQKTIGYIATPIAIIMFASLIEIFISNLKGESNIIIQPLATFINGIVWTLYAYGRKDYFLLIPNGLATVLGAMTAMAAFI
ncbi:SemiSWEET family transporter [Wenyingzhuangia sp. IMCC45533]